MDWTITATILVNIAMLLPIIGFSYLAYVSYKDMAAEAE